MFLDYQLAMVFDWSPPAAALAAAPGGGGDPPPSTSFGLCPFEGAFNSFLWG